MGKSKKGNSYKVRRKITRIVVVGNMEEFYDLIVPLSLMGLPFSHVASVPPKLGLGEILVEVIGMNDSRFPEGVLYPGRYFLEGPFGNRHALVVVDEAYDTQLERFAHKLRAKWFGQRVDSPLRECFERFLDQNVGLMALGATLSRTD